MRTRLLATLATFGILTSLTANGQGGGSGQGSPSLPQNLKTILFDAANALGMLRGLQQEDSITTLEFWATGTMNLEGKPSRVTSYRGSVRFHSVPGMRVDFSTAGGPGVPARRIHVVAGKFAWNETEPGMNATPAIEAAGERLVQLWTLPQGVVKAATAAGASTTVANDGKAIVLSFPVPAVSGATMQATLSAKNLVDRVVTRLGNVVTETTYTEYGDWNERDYKADILFPRRIVQRRDGATVLDLTVTKTNTYNPYVIMPVPENIEKSAAAGH